MLALLTCAAAGCVSAPPPQPGRAPIDPGQAFASAAARQADTLPDAWWQVFGDPVLTTLIETALAENARIDRAEANIAAARALLSRAQLAGSYATGSDAGARLGRAARAGADVELSGSAGFGASWEWDLFGRIEAGIAAADAGLVAAEESARDVAVIVAAETALAYADLRGAALRLGVSRRNARTQEESLSLLRQLFDNGRATRLDLDRAEAQYRTTRAAAPRFEAEIEAARARLAALTGQAATTLRTEDWAAGGDAGASGDRAGDGLPEVGAMMIAADPAGMLRRRPDVRAAEARLARALALGEVARARLFPTVTLSADIASVFGSLDTFGDANTIGFGIGPALVWEGPDLRRVYADIDLADADTRAAIAEYEQVVLDALAEADTALTDFAKERARTADLVAATEAAQRAADLAELRFEEGLDSFLDVLDAQRTLLEAEDRLAESRLQATRRAIAAYRALGGFPDTISDTRTAAPSAIEATSG